MTPESDSGQILDKSFDGELRTSNRQDDSQNDKFVLMFRPLGRLF